jgi:hypothetical protein
LCVFCVENDQQQTMEDLIMKKWFLCLMIVALVVACIPAHAKEASNAEKNIGNFLCFPFRIVATPVKALGRLAEGKPAAILTIPRDVRRETFDGVESLVRIPFAPPIEKEAGELGAVNTGIKDAGVDWLVDGALYGAGLGVLLHNEATWLTEAQMWRWTGAGAVGTALMDVGGAALEANED